MILRENPTDKMGLKNLYCYQMSEDNKDKY